MITSLLCLALHQLMTQQPSTAMHQAADQGKRRRHSQRQSDNWCKIGQKAKTGYKPVTLQSKIRFLSVTKWCPVLYNPSTHVIMTSVIVIVICLN